MITGTMFGFRDRGADAGLLPFLSAHLRQATESGQLLRLTGYTPWEEWARAHMVTAIGQKIGKLLETLARRSRTIGHWAKFDVRNDAPLLDAADVTEVDYLLDYLQETGSVEFGPLPVSEYRLTVAGWQALLPVGGGGLVGTCFVAMSFNPEMANAYDLGIRQAVENDCGFRVIRVDRVEHNDVITDRIVAGIRSAQFVVADVTGQRQGVYYEAGFAQALGRTVIWTCREDDFGNVHFDTRQFNHVVWSTPEDLRLKLAARIRATVQLAPQF